MATDHQMATDGQRMRAPTHVELYEGETIEARAEAHDATILVTDRRVVVTTDSRVIVDVPYHRLRRIQFDIERSRPATLVVVPEWPSDPPQTLAVSRDQFANIGKILTLVGHRLQVIDPGAA